MKLHTFFAAVLLQACGLCSLGLCGQIVYPWRATTAIVKAGESFEVWFNADAGQTVSSIILRGPYSTLTPEMAPPVTGRWVYDESSGNTFNTRIRVTVPAHSFADRYDLILKTSSGDEISTGAAKVVRHYKGGYYIMHISDVHRWQGGHDGVLLLRKVSAILDIANIIGPELLFETGDNMYNVVNHPERESSYFHGLPAEGIKGMHDTSAATFMVAGNHDTPSNNSAQDKDLAATARFYNRYYGLHAYHFRYGNGRFMVLNDAWVGFDNSSQSAAAASWLASVGRGNFRVVAAHIKDARLDKIREATDPDLILAGHTHHSANGNPHPSPGRARQYIASAVREPQYFEFNLFRVDGETGNFEAVGGPSARVPVIENPTRESIANPASWVPMLQLSFARENQGGSSSNTATLTNKYDFPLTGARVRFVMKKGSYAVTAGLIEQTLENDSVSVLDVSVDLPPRSTTTVSIGPRP